MTFPQEDDGPRPPRSWLPEPVAARHPAMPPDLPCYRYPSDTSDLEWALLERLLPVPACRTARGGAHEKWPCRRVVDAIRYITDNGAKWRALPADFGIPWCTVFGYFARWAKVGVLRHASSTTSAGACVSGAGGVPGRSA
ncbi:transposase [Streptomyces sp. NPDC050538]|uniref:transposase n=1 Tax=Streptomyces sp. NPDC050538 TaxID=3365627 RepID=UPI00379F0DCA